MNTNIIEIINLYNSGRSLKEIAKIYNTYPNKIRRAILKHYPNFIFRSQFEKKREPTKNEILNVEMPSTYEEYKRLLQKLNTSDCQLFCACLHIIRDQQSVIEKQKQIIKYIHSINYDYDS